MTLPIMPDPLPSGTRQTIDWINYHSNYGEDLQVWIGALAEALAWIENVATDDQLDQPVPALGGHTGRQLFRSLTKGGGT